MTDEVWNVQSLKQHVEAIFREHETRYQERFREQEKALDVAFTAQEKSVKASLDAADRAVNKAAESVDRRLENMNEFREQLAIQTQTFLPRPEYVVQHQALLDKLDMLEAWKLRATGVMLVLTPIAGVVGAIIVKVFFK